MALKFILSICVLIHLIGQVASSRTLNIYIADEMFRYLGQVRHSAWNIGIQWTIFTLGFIGNIALIVIFSKKDLKLRFNGLIISLAVFDLVYMTTRLMRSYLRLDSEIRLTVVVLTQVAFSCSAYTAIAISLERYILICHNM